jgi:hypothetical protein
MSPRSLRKPRFDYTPLIVNYNQAFIGDCIAVRDCDSDTTPVKEQISLCNFLRSKGLKLGVDAQTRAEEGVVWLRKLSAKEMG